MWIQRVCDFFSNLLILSPCDGPKLWAGSHPGSLPSPPWAVHPVRLDVWKTRWTVVVSKSTALNPKPVLSFPMLMNVFLSQMRIVSCIVERKKINKKKKFEGAISQVLFFFTFVMLTCQFLYFYKNKQTNKHVHLNTYKYVIWKRGSRRQFPAEELEKAHWAPNHRQTDRQTMWATSWRAYWVSGS